MRKKKLTAQATDAFPDRRSIPPARDRAYEPGLSHCKSARRAVDDHRHNNASDGRQSPADGTRRGEAPSHPRPGKTGALHRPDALGAHGLGPRAQVLQVERGELAGRYKRPGREE